MLVVTSRPSCTSCVSVSLFFFNATPPTEFYTLSLHGRSSDLVSLGLTPVLPRETGQVRGGAPFKIGFLNHQNQASATDRKSTRLNSSHTVISYAVFCLKKKRKKEIASLTDALAERESWLRDAD